MKSKEGFDEIRLFKRQIDMGSLWSGKHKVYAKQIADRFKDGCGESYKPNHLNCDIICVGDDICHNCQGIKNVWNRIDTSSVQKEKQCEDCQDDFMPDNEKDKYCAYCVQIAKGDDNGS